VWWPAGSRYRGWTRLVRSIIPGKVVGGADQRMAGRQPGFAGHRGDWVGVLCGDSWERREQGEWGTWWDDGDSSAGGGDREGMGRV